MFPGMICISHRSSGFSELVKSLQMVPLSYSAQMFFISSNAAQQAGQACLVFLLLSLSSSFTPATLISSCTKYEITPDSSFVVFFPLSTKVGSHRVKLSRGFEANAPAFER